MDTFVTILVISVFLAVLAYFKVPKVKEFVDSKVFRKKLEPSAPEIEAYSYGPDKWKHVQPSKPAVEPSKPVLATTPLTPQKESTVEPVLKPQIPFEPTIAPLKPISSEVSTLHGSNMYVQTSVSFKSPEEVKWFPIDILPDFEGRIKITIKESALSLAGDKPNYTMVLLDNHGVPISPIIPCRYTGGSLTGATENFKRFGDHFVVTPGVTYMLAVKVTTPIDAIVIYTLNGSAM